MHSTIRYRDGRLVPVVRPNHWRASTVSRSRERSERITQARDARTRWLATTGWLHNLDRRGIAELEATGIPWAAVQRWIDGLEPREAFAARTVVTGVLRVLADAEAPQRERFAIRNELYRRLIAAGILD